ncbi:MAG: preprotein translocase subunit SecD [Alphaproteobacteria bacterium]|jgi:preprotein translocase subunit SecD
MLQFSLIKKLTILAIVLLGFYYALPNVLSTETRQNLPSWMSKDTVNLGLDLQGGSHMVLQVDLDTVFKRAYENLEDEVRQDLRGFEEVDVRYRNLGAHDKNVSFTLNDPTQATAVNEMLQREITGVETVHSDGNFVLTFTESQMALMRRSALGQTLEILRSRVDEFGVAEPAIQRQGDDRIIIELPGIDDVERAKSIIGRTALLSFHLVDERDASQYINRRAPAGYKVLFEKSRSPDGRETKIPYLLKKRAALTGENLSDASSGFDQTGQNAVQISFDAKGAKQFAKLTTKFVGKRMAIVLDGQVYSAPSLREPILGGSASITGSFTSAEAQDLAMILRAGALPAPVQFAEERSIGPSLGADSVSAGKNAIVIGFFAVMVLMMLFYRGFGLAANISLLLNVVLIVGFMSLIGATMTLPGMAGIVLTIGMAVDANVLIFERIREEYRAGKKSVSRAVDEGFKSAASTIIDANVTTLIAAVVLFVMGSGPIKGFALTLSVGIASSMFTAIMITRFILTTWVLKKQPKTLAV